MTGKGPDDRGLFSPVILGFLIASVVAVFALSVLLATMSSDDTPFQATITSPSAIGHKGFYTLLERLQMPVSQSRINDTMTTGRGGVLIVDEPDRSLMSFTKDGGAKGAGLVGAGFMGARNVLLILPKWAGQPNVFHDGWVGKVEPLDLDIPRKVLELIDETGTLVRGPPPVAWTRNVVGRAPVFDGQVQLLTGSHLTPLIADGDRILLGEYATPSQRIWVLSDPDPLENHGITVPANARFAVTLVNRLRAGRSRIVFDETVHGAIAPERNPIQLLFQFPFVIVTAQIIAALALLLLATTARFGGAEEPPPPFALGKARLIDNIAALMDRAGHQAIILRRYTSVKLTEAARALHAPIGLDDPATALWLDRIGASRGMTLKAADILARSATPRSRSQLLPRLFNEARDMYRWTQDLLEKDQGLRDKERPDGPRRRQNNR